MIPTFRPRNSCIAICLFVSGWWYHTNVPPVDAHVWRQLHLSAVACCSDSYCIFATTSAVSSTYWVVDTEVWMVRYTSWACVLYTPFSIIRYIANLTDVYNVCIIVVYTQRYDLCGRPFIFLCAATHPHLRANRHKEGAAVRWMDRMWAFSTRLRGMKVRSHKQKSQMGNKAELRSINSEQKSET